MNHKRNRLLPITLNGRFYNRSRQKVHPFFWRTFYMLLVSRIKRLLARENYHEWYAPEPVVHRSIDPKITWIGHASFLVQIGGLNILLDPLFGAPSPMFNRLLPPGIALDKLPPIDVVLISHNHYDHMDKSSLMRIKQEHNSTFFVPMGDAAWFKKRGMSAVHESQWWQTHAADPAAWVHITFLPAHHWSARGLFDTNKSLWGSWMIEYGGYRIYFAGDTAWDDHFEQIKEHFGTIDVALLPIGPCEPQHWMKSTHLNAEQAGRAAHTLKARHTIAMHWGTFGFGVDHFALPVERIKAWWQQNEEQQQAQKLHVLKAGQSFSEKMPHNK